jgi:hypothetical protein
MTEAEKEEFTPSLVDPSAYGHIYRKISQLTD